MKTATRNPNRRMSDRDAALVAAALALREAERRLDELLEYPDDEENPYGDRRTLEVYSWQAGRASRDLEMNHAGRDAGLAIASAAGEEWAKLMLRAEDDTLPLEQRQAAVKKLFDRDVA